MSEIRRITVVGAGTMGHGIAQVAAACGVHVSLNDVDAASIDRGLAAIRANLERGIERGKLDAAARDATLANVVAAANLDAAAAGSDLIVEAIPERLELKRELFGRLDRAAPARAILASNTSSISIAAIGSATSRPALVVGMHFFNPVHLLPLLEVVRSDRTSEATVDAVVAFGERMGKQPIVVRDTPGFASSRLGLALGLEAIRMLEAGVASAEDIDKAMTLGYRHPMGPLRLTDLVGLDVRLAIARYLHAELGSDVFRPPALLEQLVADGRLGKKSGRGFYEW